MLCIRFAGHSDRRLSKEIEFNSFLQDFIAQTGHMNSSVSVISMVYQNCELYWLWNEVAILCLLHNLHLKW